MFQAWHRARDIIYNDKTDNNIGLSRFISRHFISFKGNAYLLMITINFKIKEEGGDGKLKER
jgi:hypothetical protein